MSLKFPTEDEIRTAYEQGEVTVHTHARTHISVRTLAHLHACILTFTFVWVTHTRDHARECTRTRHCLGQVTGHTNDSWARPHNTDIIIHPDFPFGALQFLLGHHHNDRWRTIEVPSTLNPQPSPSTLTLALNLAPTPSLVLASGP